MAGDDLAYFEQRVAVIGACRIWTGPYSAGYPRYHNGGVVMYAHRWIWEHVKGPLLNGRNLYHICGERGCVNIDHLTTHFEQSAGYIEGSTVDG